MRAASAEALTIHPTNHQKLHNHISSLSYLKQQFRWRLLALNPQALPDAAVPHIVAPAPEER
jgi:hypothetical protein